MQQTAPKTSKKFKRKLQRNLRPSIIFLLIPLAIGAVTIFLIATGLYSRNLGDFGSKRLETQNWQEVEKSLKAQQPDYLPKFAYY